VLGAGNLPGRAEGIKVDSHGWEDSVFFYVKEAMRAGDIAFCCMGAATGRERGVRRYLRGAVDTI
jgi:hypothetical protein